jgi:hypothetical protein
MAQHMQVGSLALRSDDGPTFPYAGAALLLALLAVALWARFSKGQSLPGRKWLRLGGSAAPSGLDAVQVHSTVSLDAHTRVHVITWGQRKLLVATSAHAPVVLERDVTGESP